MKILKNDMTLRTIEQAAFRQGLPQRCEGSMGYQKIILIKCSIHSCEDSESKIPKQQQKVKTPWKFQQALPIGIGSYFVGHGETNCQFNAVNRKHKNHESLCKVWNYEKKKDVPEFSTTLTGCCEQCDPINKPLGSRSTWQQR